MALPPPLEFEQVLVVLPLLELVHVADGYNGNATVVGVEGNVVPIMGGNLDAVVIIGGLCGWKNGSKLFKCCSVIGTDGNTEIYMKWIG